MTARFPPGGPSSSFLSSFIPNRHCPDPNAMAPRKSPSRAVDVRNDDACPFDDNDDDNDERSGRRCRRSSLGSGNDDDDDDDDVAAESVAFGAAASEYR